jgi:hypothetical protein
MAVMKDGKLSGLRGVISGNHEDNTGMTAGSHDFAGPSTFSQAVTNCSDDKALIADYSAEKSLSPDESAE